MGPRGDELFRKWSRRIADNSGMERGDWTEYREECFRYRENPVRRTWGRNV